MSAIHLAPIGGVSTAITLQSLTIPSYEQDECEQYHERGEVVEGRMEIAPGDPLGDSTGLEKGPEFTILKAR